MFCFFSVSLLLFSFFCTRCTCNGIMDLNIILDVLIIGIIASIIVFYFIFLVCFYILDINNLIVTQLDKNIGLERQLLALILPIIKINNYNNNNIIIIIKFMLKSKHISFSCLKCQVNL